MASKKVTTPEQKRLRKLLQEIVALPEIESVERLGELLDPRMTPQGIYKWVYSGRVPIERAREIEVLTGGRFTRQMLCPWAYV